jgi:hypothetical protein
MAKPKLTKEERRLAAAKAALQQKVEQLFAISLALIRAETAYDKYREEATKLFASGKSDKELFADVPTAVSQLRQHDLICTGTLISVYLGLLYAVVEAWRKWGFIDPRVQDRLKSPFVKDLKDHRHAIFHVNQATDPRILQWGLDPHRVTWAQVLAAELHAALLGYHQDLEGKLKVHIEAVMNP